MPKNNNSIWKKILFSFAVYAFWIGVWFIISKAVALELLVPSPITVLKRLSELLCTSDFYITIGFSFIRIISGFILGMVCGIILSFISFISKIAEGLISPIISVIKATPVASFIVMVFLFFEKSNIPTFIAFLMVIPISYENTLFGFKSIDNKIIEFAGIYGFSKKDLIFKIYAPCIKSHIQNAMKISLGLAWKAGIAAEVISNPARSIGQKILESKTYLNSADLYAWTLAIIIISILISSIFKKVFKTRKNNA